MERFKHRFVGRGIIHITNRAKEKQEAKMTKQEAIIAMEAGKKVRHKNFLENEFATMENGMMFLEDGVNIIPEVFWKFRTNPGWDNGWEIIKT